MGTVARIQAPERKTGDVIRDSALGLVPETIEAIANLNGHVWRSGSVRAKRASTSGRSWVSRPSIGVRIGPGQTALIRMPCLPYSRAAARVRPATPCLAAT